MYRLLWEWPLETQTAWKNEFLAFKSRSRFSAYLVNHTLQGRSCGRPSISLYYLYNYFFRSYTNPAAIHLKHFLTLTGLSCTDMFVRCGLLLIRNWNVIGKRAMEKRHVGLKFIAFWRNWDIKIIVGPCRSLLSVQLKALPLVLARDEW